MGLGARNSLHTRRDDHHDAASPGPVRLYWRSPLGKQQRLARRRRDDAGVPGTVIPMQLALEALQACGCWQVVDSLVVWDWHWQGQLALQALQSSGCWQAVDSWVVWARQDLQLEALACF